MLRHMTGLPNPRTDFLIIGFVQGRVRLGKGVVEFHTKHPTTSCHATGLPNPRTDFLVIGCVQGRLRLAKVVVCGFHGTGLVFLGDWW